MSQIVHIFRKDTRRFWMEILLSMVVAIAFVWVVPKEWKITHDPNSPQQMAEFAGVFAFLLGGSWWLLIARVVHEETLVGDRQFWITRPYGWRQLRAAKLLFFAVWIGVPYLLTETWLLAAAGFHPLPYLAGLLGRLVLVATMILLPVFALATVTSSFGRLTLTLLGGFVLLVGFSFVFSRGSHTSVVQNAYVNVVNVPLLFAGCAAAILIGYARRRTWIARGLLIAIPVLLAIWAFAYRRQSLVDDAYPLPASGAAPLVDILSMPTPAYPLQARSWDGQDYIDMPAQYSGVAEGTAVIFDDVRFTLTSVDGSSWTSPWQKMDQRILPGTHFAGLHLPAISPTIYDKFKTGPLTLKVTFATSRYQADIVANSVYPKVAAEVAVPGVGICTAAAYYPAWLHCRAPLRQPRLTYATVSWSTTPCSAQMGATGVANAWFDRELQGPFLASVWDRDIWFSPIGDERHGQVCPGSPMKVTQYRLLDRARTDFILQNFVLPANVSAT
jgi:hypothetical protein